MEEEQYPINEIHEAYLQLSFDSQQKAVEAANQSVEMAVVKVRDDVGAPKDFIYDHVRKVFRARTPEEVARMGGQPVPVPAPEDADQDVAV